MYNYYGLSYTMTKLDEVLTRFSESAEKEMEYKYADGDYTNAYSARNSLVTACKRFGKRNIKVSTRNQKVILTKI